MPRVSTSSPAALASILMDGSRDAIFLTTRTGRIREASAAAERLYGYTRLELLRLNVRDLWRPTADDEWARQMPSTDRVGTLLATTHRRKDGSTFPVEVSWRNATVGGARLRLFFVRDLTGRLTGTGAYHDTANDLGEAQRLAEGAGDHARAEEALRASERRFRAAFKTGTDVYELTGRDDGRLVDVNDQFEALYGYTRGEALGRTSLELGLWAHPATRQEMLAELAAEGAVRNWLVTARRKNGETFPVLYSVTELEGTRPPLLLCVIRDVTEVERAERLLRDQHERLRHLTDHLQLATTSANLGTWDWDVGSGRLEWSPQMYGLFGLDPALHATTLVDGWKAAVHPEDRQQIQTALADALKHDGDLAHEYRIVGLDGQVRWIYATGRAARDGSGSVRMTGVCLDITERKRAEDALLTREQEYRSLFESMHTGMVVLEVIVDASGRPIDHRLVQANAEFEAQTGLKREEQIGRTSAELGFSWPPDVAHRSSIWPCTAVNWSSNDSTSPCTGGTTFAPTRLGGASGPFSFTTSRTHTAARRPWRRARNATADSLAR